MESLKELLPEHLKNTADTFDRKAFEQRKADDYNKMAGTLHERDGYDCPICKNKGDIMTVEVEDDGWPYMRMRACKCKDVRASITKMQQSGLGNVIRDKSFDKFQVLASWQQTVKDAAMAYAKDPHGWFFMGGQSGCGKSHLGTAICREFLLAGQGVTYMVWPDEAPIIKGAAKDDPDRREKLVGRLKKAEVLYVDDLFKPDRDAANAKQRPTGADIRLAFEILNYRYNNPALLTIISSEFSTDELLEIDQALGSRIFEMSEPINIAEDVSRNYRLRKSVTV